MVNQVKAGATFVATLQKESVCLEDDKLFSTVFSETFFKSAPYVHATYAVFFTNLNAK